VSLPAGYTARAATLGDVDATAWMHDAVDLELHGEAESSRLFVEETWRSTFVDLPTMTRLILAPDATVAAAADLESAEPASSIDGFVRVHPAHRGRGLGSWLIGWSEEAAAALVPAEVTTRLWSSVSAADPAGLELVRSRDYQQVRTFWHMRMELDPRIEPGPVPDGVAIRTSVQGRDDRGIHEAMSEAFVGHFGYVHIPFDRWWHEMRSSSTYDPSMILVAEEEGDIVGASSQFVNAGVGWVGEIGVRPTGQGRGIGRALLRHGLADLARRGLRIAQLNVDSENERGATRLYESVGMRASRSWLVFEKRIAGTKLPA
jgi:mycothiol synthase